jgi:hypothetical protein
MESRHSANKMCTSMLPCKFRYYSVCSAASWCVMLLLVVNAFYEQVCESERIINKKLGIIVCMK